MRAASFAGVVALLVATGACRSFEVTVTFEVAPQYAELIAELVISVFVPTEQQPIDCEDLQFDFDRYAPIQQTELFGDVAVPIDIDRTGRKLVVIRGLDVQDLLVVAGCGEVGDVGGKTTLAIGAEPAAVAVALDYVPAAVAPLPMSVTVFVRDVLDEPIEGVPLLVAHLQGATEGLVDVDNYRVLETDFDGEALVTPILSPRPGPEALDIHPRSLARLAPGLVETDWRQEVSSVLQGLARPCRHWRIVPAGRRTATSSPLGRRSLRTAEPQAECCR